MPRTPFVAMQYLLPHHLLSRVVGRLAECRWPPVKGPFIRWFIRRYGVDMNEAREPDPAAYSCFNAFFTRALRDGARPLADDPDAVVCPADGGISQLGRIDGETILQAKDHRYSLGALLGADGERSEPFRGGHFITVYLSPRDYHRVHMPFGGRLLETHYIPGRLFSVNQRTTDEVPGLFARNERLVCLFETQRGPMAIVLVGAMIVAGIETVWAGRICPTARGAWSEDFRQQHSAVELGRGEELGRFQLGSTVIVLFGPAAAQWRETLQPGNAVRMGQALT